MAANVKKSKGKPKPKAKKKAKSTKKAASGPVLERTASPPGLCPPDVMVDIADKCDAIAKTMDSKRGTIGQMISDAATRHNLHPAAFKILCKIRKWPEAKIAEWQINFEHGWRALGLNKMTGQLDLGDREEPTEEEAAPLADKPKRSRSRKGADQPLADAMGEAIAADQPEFGPEAAPVEGFGSEEEGERRLHS